jgi:hypothetical protein
MVYAKKTWSDRVVERPLTYTMQTNADGSTTLIPAEGSVVAAGTAITAAALNNMENGIANAVERTGDTMTGDLTVPNLIVSGNITLANKLIKTKLFEVLWTGAALMIGSSIITPSRTLTDCDHGWMLEWSEAGAGNYDFNYTFVSKKIMDYTGQTTWGFWSNIQSAFDTNGSKYLYVQNGTQLQGHDKNQDAGGRVNTCLRRVMAW